jgi:hypothetical protein
MHETLKEETKQKEQADREIQAMKAEIEACSRDNNISDTERKPETPREKVKGPLRRTSRQVLPPDDTLAGGGNSNFHSDQRTVTPLTK